MRCASFLPIHPCSPIRTALWNSDFSDQDSWVLWQRTGEVASSTRSRCARRVGEGHVELPGSLFPSLSQLPASGYNWFRSLHGPVSGSPFSLTIGSEGWLLTIIVLRNSSLAGPFTHRATVGRLPLQANFLMRLFTGLR